MVKFKFMKKLLSITMILSSLFLLCSCARYTSSYKALGLVKNQTSHSIDVRFRSLQGQLVYKLKKSKAQTEGNVSYSLQVDEGEIVLYYDANGVKEELARAKAGETVEDVGGYVEGGHTVYIIIEATEKARGRICVELDHEYY